MFKANGIFLILNFVFVFLLCYKGLHDKLKQKSFPTQRVVFDSCLQAKVDVFTIQCENHFNNYTACFTSLNCCKCKPFDIRKNIYCLAYLFSLLNPGPVVDGPVEPDSDVRSTYLSLWCI